MCQLIGMNFPPRFKKYLALIVVLLVFLFGVFKGFQAGKFSAQAQVLSQNALAIQKGLEYYYSDQDYFPTAAEYQNPQLMLTYLSASPAVNLASAQCSDNFVYNRPSLRSFVMDFCLPAGFGSYHTGWNRLAEDKSQAR